MSTSKWKQTAAGLVMASLAAFWPGASAAAGEPIRIGVSTFLSGAGAVFGVPAQQTAQYLVEQINKAGGIKGSPVELTFLDENRGVDNTVVEFRALVESKRVDAMIIGLSSSICLAVAPAAEELKMPTMFWDCGTERLYEERKYDYVYRTSDWTPPNNLAVALYMLKSMPEVKTVAGINQDYAFGRDNWAAFKQAVQTLRPDVKIVAELFPKLGTSDYSTEISKLSALRPDVVFTSLWGGDMNTFIRQSSSRSLFRNATLVSPNGESSLQQLGKSFPENAIIGVRGDSWALDPKMANVPGHQAFIDAIKERTGAYPSFPSYHMAQAIRSIQVALEKNWDGSRETLQRDLLAGWKNLSLKDFTGELALREDNQAVEGQLVGVTGKSDAHNFMVLNKLVLFPGDLITPPAGTKAQDWLKALPAGTLEKFNVPAKN
ncbi:ABC transporter substrate-binding protein [Parapusillimonas granuli]|uniref:ABC transporter substrate-binding protein n=1 Tax=Parapusillimonas granuli TaxID=380911 RepID=A0A853FT64_9BURK|nr:ABC transporter substrate-binding protein [Parapusillimonas granuli]MBB5214498.1 branched-chain amino acid transport system substrate-binding protein [Parapusillimonas granuli]MEB2398258.1 ABC transporter substrate-binding protein [Alcaligenaceae bacterium]NYT49094.1 ABC transporter substrate-binding protein [Parapusillimonas granuli]